MLEVPQKHQTFSNRPELGSSVDSEPFPAGCRRHSPSEPTSSSVAAANGGNVDSVLFKNLVEMVPLVETLMDRRAKSSFTRRASMVYTPAPSQLRKMHVAEPNGRKTAQTISAKKRRDTRENANLNNATDDFSIFSSRAVAGNAEKEREELTVLRKQVDDLHKKLVEKDEALKSAKNSMNQIAEKDSLIKSIDSQLYNANINLADKQATLEKLEWEAKTSNRKVEELQGNVVSMEFEATALIKLFEELSKNDPAACPDFGIDAFYHLEPIPHIDDIDEIEMEKMEEARRAYVAAVAAAKENPSEDSIAVAAEARRWLQAFVL